MAAIAALPPPQFVSSNDSEAPFAGNEDPYDGLQIGMRACRGNQAAPMPYLRNRCAITECDAPSLSASLRVDGNCG